DPDTPLRGAEVEGSRKTCLTGRDTRIHAFRRSRGHVRELALDDRRCGWGSGEGGLAASEEVEECGAHAEGRSDDKGAQDRCDCQEDYQPPPTWSLCWNPPTAQSGQVRSRRLFASDLGEQVLLAVSHPARGEVAKGRNGSAVHRCRASCLFVG